MACLCTALRHRRRVQRKSLLLRVHPDGALLPAAEAAAGHPRPAGGTGWPLRLCHLNAASIKQSALFFLMFQIFEGTTVPQRMVDGWNAFFCDNLSDLVSLHTRLALRAKQPRLLRRLSLLCVAAPAPLGAAAQHGVCGRAVARAAALLHRRV